MESCHLKGFFFFFLSLFVCLMIRISQTFLFVKDYVDNQQIRRHFVGDHGLDFSPAEQEATTAILPVASCCPSVVLECLKLKESRRSQITKFFKNTSCKVRCWERHQISTHTTIGKPRLFFNGGLHQYVCKHLCSSDQLRMAHIALDHSGDCNLV